MAENNHIPQKHWSTPSKAKVEGAKDFVVAQGLPHTNRQLFRHFNIPETSGRRILQNAPRRYQNNPYSNEKRGRKKALESYHIDAIEKLLWDGGAEARSLPWGRLLGAAGCGFEGTEPCTRTIQRALQQKDWRKCIVCSKSWTSPTHAKLRKEAAQEALRLRPRPEDWEDIRFSGESHVLFGQKGQHKVARKPGERECPDCIQHGTRPTADGNYRLHCWAAIGYGFKSPLIWYTTRSNNGALTQREYIDQILEPVVKPWLAAGHQFILEEDSASGQGPMCNGIVARWKEKHGLGTCFNTAAGSVDLAPMENAWKVPKAYMREHAIWDEDALKMAAEDGWDAVLEGTLNDCIHSIPQRMKNVIAADGQLISW
jgi:hypothetical protein